MAIFNSFLYVYQRVYTIIYYTSIVIIPDITSPFPTFFDLWTTIVAETLLQPLNTQDPGATGATCRAGHGQAVLGHERRTDAHEALSRNQAGKPWVTKWR